MSSDRQPTRPDARSLTRLSVRIRGAVQGVGFRPFVYRLASELMLRGWVSNSNNGLVVELEGTRRQLENFVNRLEVEKPRQAIVQTLESAWLEPAGYTDFEIRDSDGSGRKTTLVLPDLATCPDCLREIRDPSDRRFGYPFTNCTDCGPRFTIIHDLPYDRARTSMRGFRMCEACEREYNDPMDRRFHAQPNACPACGPQLALWDNRGSAVQSGQEALPRVAALLAQGAIVAVKGLGGFHLLVKAGDSQAVERLRRLKRREEKPFALMFPSLERVRRACQVSKPEEALLGSVQAPIVLLRRATSTQAGGRDVSPAVAPGNPYLGVMLPYTPLHHLLMDLLGFPVVATSGNLAEEPICIDEHEAVKRLQGIADAFLVHNRPIVRHADDSIARVIAGREMLLRRARGYAPLPITLAAGRHFPGPAGDEAPKETGGPSVVLAVGGHFKNSVGLAVGPEVFIGQHIGDMSTTQAYSAFQAVISDLQRFYEVKPEVVAADLHPDYLSTRYAQQSGFRVVQVQHHYAHLLSCMAEHGLEQDVLGVSWDGTGFGSDGTVWGGEFLVDDGPSFERVAHLRVFRLPGAEKAVREPRRSALAVLYEVFGDAAFELGELAPVRAFAKHELRTLRQMLRGSVNSPVSSSAGRLFDAVAALVGLRQCSSFEGQAAMELEFAAEGCQTAEAYPIMLTPGSGARTEGTGNAGAPSAATVSLVVDWGGMVGELLEDLRKKLPPALISVKFHNSLVEGILQVARRVGRPKVVLTGGCFQNQYLTERSVAWLQGSGFEVFWHRRVPPNDGGIALGQVMAVRRTFSS